MAPFAFSIKKEGKDSAIGCEGDWHSLLGCRGVDFGQIPGTWANHHCCSLCPDTHSVVHCTINVRDETSLSCMTTLTPTPIASHRKQLQRWGGKFFHTPPIALIWHHLFGFVKNQLRGQRYEATEAIQKAVRQCFRMAGTEFYRRGIFKLPERWEKCVQRSGDYVEK